MVDYIDKLSYVDLSLNHLEEVYQIIVNDLLDIFLDSVGKYFIDYFPIYINMGNSSVFFFLC